MSKNKFKNNKEVIGFKLHLIKTLLSIMKVEFTITNNISVLYASLNSRYSSLTEEDLIDIYEKYNYEEYLKRIAPVFDENFNIQELQELIKFYNSKVGSKLMSSSIQKPIENIGRIFFAEMEQDFKNKIK